MTWLETDPVTERKRFIMEWLAGEFSVTELCLRHEISRKSGYKWITRYEREGPEGLEDRSRRPNSCPWAAEPDVIEEAIRIRYSRRQPLGARKVRPQLVELLGERQIPSVRTLHNHFLRRGLVKKRRRSRKRPHPGKPTAPFDAPNSVWSADFKGQFKTLDGRYCYPLTVQDGFSRYLLGCQGLAGTRFLDTKRVFTRLFHEFGLPTRIRTDNGVPFASMAPGRLSQLSVWWIKLGILPDLIEPASPQQNGRHERMHRTLKAETAIPPAGDRSAQQRRFNEFRSYFNDVRSHESLDDQTPARSQTHAVEAQLPGLSRPLRGPKGLEQRRHPLALSLDQRLASARRRVHRPRGDRVRRLGRLLRPRLTRLASYRQKSHPRPRWLLLT